MSDIILFLFNHWMLSLLFCILLIAYIANELWQSKKSAGNQVSVSKAIILINHNDAKVLDVRGEQAYKDGHIVDAINIPASLIDKKITHLHKFKEKPIIVICKEGREAVKIANRLTLDGFKAMVLEGGIQAWRMADMPLVKD